MTVKTGLQVIVESFPNELKNKRVGLLCHAASVDLHYNHAIDFFTQLPCTLSALFGPQHGMFGQTQDNMIEWEGALHPVLNIPVFSLYGRNRKPTPAMLALIDVLVIDLQDVGARPYTYIWTVKLCMEACMEQGLPLWILDRPNPIGAVALDGPMLEPEYFSFVGGAMIPLCHRLTIGEIAMIMQMRYFPSLNLRVGWMEGWKRSTLFHETGLPWVLPSPNMPTEDTAIVYPGMVLLEATNLSEGRGTTRPFEIIGAPFVRVNEVMRIVNALGLPGCIVREHGFIPTFQKWHGQYCNGLQVHVTDPTMFRPVETTVMLIAAIMETSGAEFAFKQPPYEYETHNAPFDILSGSAALRTALENHESISSIRTAWKESHDSFAATFKDITHYPVR